MQFMCINIFRGYQQTPYFDASFIEFPPVNPKLYHELSSNISKILDPSKDRVLKLKKEENKLGIYEENYHETSIDWLLILRDSQLEIYKIEGLRNFPCKNIQIINFNQVRMNAHPRDFHGACKIFSASCRDLNDVISIYCLNSSFQLIKFRKSFAQIDSQSPLSKMAPNLIQTHQWRIENIREILVHSSLPFVAYIMNDDEIYFFIEEESNLQVVKTNDMKFAGAYSIHNMLSSHHQNDKSDHKQQNNSIKKAKWVKDLCQMMILYTNNSVGLLSSHSLLRILASTKHPEEYLKLWNEKHRPTTQKWDRLYEIEFQTEDNIIEGNQNEKIIDFEIVDTKINSEEGTFAIIMVIFSDNYMQYVYQIETTIQSGMKSESQSTQLMAIQTSDCLLKIIGSYNNFDHNQRVALVVLTEIDPLTAPQPNENEIQDKQNDFEGFGDNDDSEDEEVDIFGNSSKKEKYKPIKKKEQIEPQKVQIEPIKQELRLKLLTLEIKDSENGYVDIRECLKVELPLDYKHKQIISRITKDFIGFLVQEGINLEKVLYIYELASSRYLGFINFTQLLKLSNNNVPLDFTIASDTAKGSIIAYTNNSLYLISQSAKQGLPGKWSIIKVIKNVTGLDSVEIKSAEIHETFYKKLIFMINNKYVKIKNRFCLGNKDDEEDEENKKHSSLHQIFSSQQTSFPLFDYKLLKALFIKGYKQLALKILVKLQQIVLTNNNFNEKVSDFLDFDIEQLNQEIQEQIKIMNEQGGGLGKSNQKNVETSSSLFDDYYEPDQTIGVVNIEQKVDDHNKNDSQRIEIEFENNFQRFIDKLQSSEEETKQLLNSLGLTDIKQLREFLIFLKKFRCLYKKDFFASPLTNILLSDLFYDTEDVILEYEEEEKNKVVQAKPLNMQDVMIQAHAAQMSKGSLSLIGNWTSFQCALALISEDQDVILDQITERFDFENTFNWNVMRKFCIPLWLKDTSKLKFLVEKVAKGEYKGAGDEFGKTCRAEKTALWYILLGKKQQLCSLYKMEAQYKRVYDLLTNDFNDKKWKTTAEKNAMVLMSKQNYLLAISFFLLAQNIQSALQIALTRLEDPILGILICRVFEVEESERVKDIYLQYFVNRGEKYGDPYLVSIGRWLRKEYVKSVNSFKIEMGDSSQQQNMFKPNIQNMDIAIMQQEEQKKIDNLEGAQLTAAGPSTIITNQPVENEEQINKFIPRLSKYDYFTLDIIKAMKKLPALKRELNKKWESKVGSNKGGGGGLFDDFWGGEQDSSSNQQNEDERKMQEENKLQVNEAQILQLVSFDASQCGLPLVSLLILNENEEHIQKVEQFFKFKIAKTFLNDLSHSFSANNDFSEQVHKANSSIQVFALNLQIDQNDAKEFIISQCAAMGLIGLEISFYLDLKLDDVAFRLEDYAIKLIDFIQSVTDFPFILDTPHKQSKQQSNSSRQLRKIMPIIGSLEQIVECLLRFSCESNSPKKLQEQSPLSDDMQMHSLSPQRPPNFPTQTQITGGRGASGQVQGLGSKNKGQNQSPPIDHTKTGRKYSDGINDNESDQIINIKNASIFDKQQFTYYKDQHNGKIIFQNKQDNDKQSNYDKEHTKLNTQIRTALIVVLALIQICFLTKMLDYVPSLIALLRNILQPNQTSNKDNQPNKQDNQFNIDYQKLKIKIQKIKYGIQAEFEQENKQQINELKDEEEQKYGKSAFEQAEEEKKKKEKEAQQALILSEQKTKEFYSLWLKYITAYNTFFVLKSSFQSSQIQSLINIRPSIINNRSIQEVIVSILNQRLQSGEMIKKLENMYRILENVTSYYFEQLLTMKERKNIVDSLTLSKDSDFKRNFNSVFLQLFEVENKYIKFGNFMDLKTFISYLKEHDLSLIYHTSRDLVSVDAFPMRRTNEIFQSGVELFRLKNDSINGFAFDHCGKDMVSLAMLNKGIREIYIQKTLICRNRSNNGLNLVDEELSNWNECLHRYDKYPSQIPNNNLPIIAIIDKVYRQKTIHFIREDKRQKQVTISDYTQSPPAFWGGQKYTEYLKSQSNLEILHEDYTYSLESHPYLPLYVSGNAKGLMCLWSYEQDNDKSIDQWITELDQKNANPKKATIKKMQFSSYGDKLACMNMEGSFFIYNFDTFESSKLMPIFNLKKTKEQKFYDFEYLNQDTVLAMTSLKPNKLWIFDTLIPQNKGLVLESNICGNLLISSNARQLIYTFNERPGQMSIYNIRANKVQNYVQLHNEEITAVAQNEAQDSMVVGFKDGIVKIYNIDKSGELEVRETQLMFPAVSNKKGAITQIRLHPTTGALYASSTTGYFKLLRTKV